MGTSLVASFNNPNLIAKSFDTSNATKLSNIYNNAFDHVQNTAVGLSRINIMQMKINNTILEGVEKTSKLSKEIQNIIDEYTGLKGVGKGIGFFQNALELSNGSGANSAKAQIEKTSETWQKMKAGMGEGISGSVGKLFDTINQNLPNMLPMFMGITSAISIIISGVASLLGGISNLGGLFEVIAPIILAIVTAMGLYNAALLVNNAIAVISNGIGAISTSIKYAHSAITPIEAMETSKLTAAQLAFNAALVSCPLTWILVAIIAIIAAIFIVIQIIKQVTGTTFSAVGVIFGLVASIGTFIQNMIILFINLIIDVANFIANIFNDPVAAVTMLFLNMFISVMEFITELATGIETLINSIPGIEINITSKLNGFNDSLKDARQRIEDESGWKEYIAKVDFVGYEDNYMKGYDKGNSLQTGAMGLVSDMFSGLDKGNPIVGNTAQTAANTGTMANSISKTEESLAYLRDKAELEAINRFTTAELKVDFTNNATINGTRDIDGVMNLFRDKLREVVETGAEEVHVGV